MNSDLQVFCTVFDKNYLYQGVALYSSLRRCIPHFKLYCLLLDDESVSAFRKLNFPEVQIVTLSMLDQEQVSYIRPLVTYPQFCWSMQPMVCRHALDQNERGITYIEADAMFVSDAKPLFDEIGEGNASLSPHFYSEAFLFHEAKAGKYCTQFNFFRNNDEGRQCLEFWRQENFRYRKENPHAFPGQTALNFFKENFKGVVELKNRGAGVAPWNIQQYEVSREGPNIFINRKLAVFYHFHQVSRYPDGTFDLGEYPLSQAAIEYFYKPYIREVVASEKLVRTQVPEFNFKKESKPPPSLVKSLMLFRKADRKKAIHNFIRKLKGEYYVLDPNKI